MNFPNYASPIAGGLIVIIGVIAGLGGKALWGGAPESWTDAVASDAIIRRIAIGLFTFSLPLLAAGLATIFGLPYARPSAAVVIILFVLLAFPANYYLFGNIRPIHTGTNLVIAAVILSLLKI